ncbi:MAG: mechanosensitive ion channel protein, partial [Polaromonas sp.]
MAGAVSSRAAAPARIDNLEAWFAALAQPTALTEVAALVGCVLLAWLLVRVASRSQLVTDGNSVLYGRRQIDGVLFPLLLLLFAYAVQAMLSRLFPVAVFKV